MSIIYDIGKVSEGKVPESGSICGDDGQNCKRVWKRLNW